VTPSTSPGSASARSSAKPFPSCATRRQTRAHGTFSPAKTAQAARTQPDQSPQFAGCKARRGG
jgi:hypothetical protein